MVKKQLRQRNDSLKHNYYYLVFIYIFTSLLYFSYASSRKIPSVDVEILRERIIGPYLNSEISLQTYNYYVTNLRSDGTWVDLDYEDRTPSDWNTVNHLRKLNDLTILLKSSKSPYRDDPELKQNILNSLDYWLNNDFSNPNWWWNDIGVPRIIAPILLLLEPDMNENQMQKGINILSRARMGMTGQNLVWVSEISFYRGILEKDEQLIKDAFQRISSEIKISTDEGIQPDFTFHQHGPCLYSHGYGGTFAIDCSRIAKLVSGIPYEFSQEKIDILSNYILNGMQWLTRGKSADFGAEGREIARKSQNAGYLLEVVNNMLDLKTNRRDEFSFMLDCLNEKPNSFLIGNRHFWRSDIMTHHRQKFYASIRMHSERVVSTDEPHNGEGLKSHHLADGCNILIRNGDEYFNIFPVWNWNMIPGTTTIQSDEFEGTPRKYGLTDFVGGVSDGQYGFAAYDFKDKNIQARKSWFFFDDEYVCLGNSIKATIDRQVLTNINQCYLTDQVVGKVGDEIRKFRNGQHEINGVEWIFHNGVAYIFHEKNNIYLSNDIQTGSWNDINQSESREIMKREILNININHGIAPTDASYSYIVVPSINLGNIDDYIKKNGIQILRNTSQLQIVWQRKLNIYQFVFYEKGLVQINNDEFVQVDKPCLLMIRDKRDTWDIVMSDPTQKISKVNLILSGKFEGENCKWNELENSSKILFQLPQKGYAGQSTRKILKKQNSVD